MYNKKSKVRVIISSIFQFLVTFLIFFVIVSVLVIGPKKSFERITGFIQASFGKVDTEVKINDNTIIDEKSKPKVEKTDNSLKEGKNIKIDVPDDEQVLPKFNEKKYEKAVKMYSENEVSGLSNAWYYSQLDENGKLIYRKLKSESAYFLEGVHKFDFGYVFNDLLQKKSGQAELEESFQASVNALLFDFPELFFVEVKNISLQIQKTTYYGNKNIYSVVISNATNKTFYVEELDTRQKVDAARQRLNNIRYNIMERVENPLDPYQIIKTAHDYILDTVSYDTSVTKPNIYNMYGALVNHQAVCEGYAKTLKYFLDYYKIPNIIVAGKGYKSEKEMERHAWNYVYINGKWYGIDSTWDDPIMIGGGAVPKIYRYKYFLKGGKEFLKTHIPDGEIIENYHFRYPDIANSDYVR